MRVPGVHVLLTAGIVAVTSIGTVAAFSLTGSSEAEQRLPAVAPPPAASAPLDPAPLPIVAPQPQAPVVAAEPTDEPTRAAEPQRDDSASDDRDADTPDRSADPPKDDDRDGPKRTVKADPNGTDEQKLAYACRNGLFHGRICKNYT